MGQDSANCITRRDLGQRDKGDRDQRENWELMPLQLRTLPIPDPKANNLGKIAAEWTTERGKVRFLQARGRLWWRAECGFSSENVTGQLTSSEELVETEGFISVEGSAKSVICWPAGRRRKTGWSLPNLSQAW